jgi:hypothetical protein
VAANAGIVAVGGRSGRRTAFRGLMKPRRPSPLRDNAQQRSEGFEVALYTRAGCSNVLFGRERLVNVCGAICDMLVELPKIVESCRSVRLNKYASWGSVVVMFFVTRVVREKKE